MISLRPSWLLGQLGLVCLLACGSNKPAGSSIDVPRSVAKQHTEWALALDASGDVAVTSVAVAASGHVFVAGEYSGTLRAGEHRITSRGPSDGFLAKLSAQRKPMWLHSYGGDGRDGIRAIAIADAKAIVIAGDRGDRGFVHWASAADGSVSGARPSLHSSEHISVRDVAVDKRGNAVVVGHFTGSLRVDSTTKWTSAGVQDAFVARFGRDGKAAWLVRFGGPRADHAHAVAVHADQIVVAGGFTRSAYFGAQLVASRGRSYDAFLASLSLSGGVTWVKPMGGDRDDTATAVAVDDAGTIYVAGSFDGAASFGIEPIMATDGPDVFLTAVTSKGKTRWTKHFGGSSGERALALAATAKHVYLLGSFIGTTRVKDYPIRGELKHDGFLASFTSAGKLHSARAIAGKGDESVTDLAIDAEGAAVVGGSFIGETTLVPGKPMANDDKVTAGFVVRLSP